MDDKLKRDAVALVVLAHKDVVFSSAKAARKFGRTRQRWHQRLKVLKANGWVGDGDPPKLTPRGVEVLEGVLMPLRQLRAAGEKVNIMELLAGPWRRYL